jgi:hypothetical protein
VVTKKTRKSIDKKTATVEEGVYTICGERDTFFQRPRMRKIVVAIELTFGSFRELSGEQHFSPTTKNAP